MRIIPDALVLFPTSSTVQLGSAGKAASSERRYGIVLTNVFDNEIHFETDTTGSE